MECNKDEAIRAKVIAERKLTEKDFAGAKKFALKAQNLYPELEGLSQMLTILDVYISAENKVSGEVDWYGVLGVNPTADDETVKRQYRKLALILHPDKNKSIGADGAFKLLSEAWSLLSDKAKRLAYNQRRSSKGFQQKVPAKSRGQSVPTSANGFHNFSNTGTSNTKTQNSTARGHHSSAPPSYPRTDTFWTICHRCKMHYEYLRMYLNHTLLCPNCREAFLASETSPPFNFSKPSSSSSQQRYQNPGHRATNGNQFNPGTNAGVGIAKAANVQANEKLKRECEEAQAAVGWERLLKKRRGLDDDGNGSGGNMARQMAMGNGGTSLGNSFGLRKGGLETDRVYRFSGVHGKPNSIRDLTQLEMRNMLMEKARTEICKKLKEWRSAKNEKMKDKEKERRSVKTETRELVGNGVSSGSKGGDQSKKNFIKTSANNKDEEFIEPTPINVPDPDFHDFDQDRTERAFGDNQVWAAYDDADGMPRFYAVIHKVISLKPFTMQISWLNSKTSSEFGPIDWVGSGFYKTCGDFRVGKYEFNKSLNSFSHKIKWARGPRGTVCILPKKGDVWALYRNWSPDWNEHTADEVIHKYDMVEVLEDYNEDQGVSVAPLVKVTGFRTVFQACTVPEKVRKIPKAEMFRFSHQVPNYLLTGLEAQNAPKGCQELDPAATPLELLQVITEANETTMEENERKAGKETLQNAPEIRVDVISTTKTKEEQVVANGEESPEREMTDIPK